MKYIKKLLVTSNKKLLGAPGIATRSKKLLVASYTHVLLSTLS